MNTEKKFVIRNHEFTLSLEIPFNIFLRFMDDSLPEEESQNAMFQTFQYMLKGMELPEEITIVDIIRLFHSEEFKAFLAQLGQLK